MLKRHLPARTALLLLVATSLAEAGCRDQPKDAGLADCEFPHTNDALLRLATRHGDISIDFYEEAAPLSVRAVKNLACFGVVEAPSGAAPVDEGFYDGLVIDHTQPNIEIRLSKGEGHDDIRIPKEINAESIGLDKQVVENAGQAMDMYQFVIHKEYGKNKRSADHSDTLREWISEFDRANDASFLIGKSRREINAALGYPYIDTVESHPIERGAVLLEPNSKTHSSPRIVIALDVLENYTGKWTVIGEVVDGLDTVHRISRMPNTGRAAPRWKPIDPVEIVDADIVSAGSGGP